MAWWKWCWKTHVRQCGVERHIRSICATVSLKSIGVFGVMPDSNLTNTIMCHHCAFQAYVMPHTRTHINTQMNCTDTSGCMSIFYVHVHMYIKHTHAHVRALAHLITHKYIHACKCMYSLNVCIAASETYPQYVHYARMYMHMYTYIYTQTCHIRNNQI